MKDFQSACVLLISLASPCTLAGALINQGNPQLNASVSASGHTYLYVTNEGDNTVSVIDTADNKTKKIISGIKHPYNVTAAPGGNRIIVASDANTVAMIDTVTNTVVGTLSLGHPAYSVAFSPDGRIAYIGCDADSIIVVNMTTFTVTGTIRVPGESWPGIAIDHDGRHLYVSRNSGTIMVDVSTGAVTKVSPVGSGPMSTVMGPEGHRVYVAGWNESKHENELVVIDTENSSAAKEMPLDVYPLGIALSADADRIYLSHCNNETAEHCQEGFLSVFDMATEKVVNKIGLGANTYPYGVAISRDGAHIYVADDNSPGTVTVVDARRNKVEAVIRVGTTPFGVAVVSVPAAVTTNQ